MECINCKSDRTCEVDGFVTCTLCGVVDPNPRYVFNMYANHVQMKKRSIYKRINHFKFKLRAVQGKLIPPHQVMGMFQGSTINSISDVRYLLKKNNATKHNKYAYFIYKQCTGKNIFKFSCNEEHHFVSDFIKINLMFKRKRPTERRNIFNYHFILRKILELRGYNTLNLLCEPKMKAIIDKNERQFDDIMS
jgi:hypothetical protein